MQEHYSHAPNTNNYAGKCDYPVVNQSIKIDGYTAIATQGTTITLSCQNGLESDAPTTLICMSTGQWWPDPMGVDCVRPDPTGVDYVWPDPMGEDCVYNG